MVFGPLQIEILEKVVHFEFSTGTMGEKVDFCCSDALSAS